jgi:NADPH:quinone reductase-like Zn-dependent oxidoreductase
MTGNGTLQEYLLADPSWPIAHKPRSLSFSEAAALPLVYSTVHDALVKHGRLPFQPKPEDVGKRTVLILGGSSGTGSVAIQLAKKMGLKVGTTCSTKKVDFVKSLGADEVRCSAHLCLNW